MNERPKIRRIVERLCAEQRGIDAEIEEKLELLKNLRIEQQKEKAKFCESSLGVDYEAELAQLTAYTSKMMLRCRGNFEFSLDDKSVLSFVTALKQRVAEQD